MHSILDARLEGEQRGAWKNILAPPNLRHRYIAEDIPYGLVPLAYLGDLLKVPTPVSDAMIELASIANGVDYWKTGLTLEKLGLNGLTAEEILKTVNHG